MPFRKVLWLFLIALIGCLTLIKITGGTSVSGEKPITAMPVIAGMPPLSRGIVPILMYHKVSPHQQHGSLGLRVTPADFEAQMKYLKENGFTSVSLDQLIDYWAAGRSLPPRPVVITFDDGYEDNYLYAYPVLKKYRFTATIFLVCNNIDGYNDWELNRTIHPRVKLLSWPQIREMQRHGFSFQSHTLTHPSLTLISPEEARTEIQQSRAQLSKLLDAPVNFLAYPYGRSDEKIENLARNAGYKGAVSTLCGKNGTGINLFKLKRLGVDGNMNLEQFARMLEH